MSTKTPKTTLFSNKNARSRQEKSAESRLRKNAALRKRFADMLQPEFLDLFALVLVNARPSDLRRAWSFANGGTVHFSDDEYSEMQGLGVAFAADTDADDIGEVPEPPPVDLPALLAEIDAMSD